MRFLLAAALVASALTLHGAQIPRPAPDLAWYAADGSQIQLSKHKGKVVILEVMSTTCPHCQQSAQLLSRLQAEFAGKVQVLGLAINDDANAADFIRTYRVNFPVGKGKREDALGFLQHSVMSPLYFPGMVFIDRNGVIQAQYHGADAFLSTNQESNIRQQIQKMLGSGGSAKPAPASKKTKSRKAS